MDDTVNNVYDKTVKTLSTEISQLKRENHFYKVPLCQECSLRSNKNGSKTRYNSGDNIFHKEWLNNSDTNFNLWKNEIASSKTSCDYSTTLSKPRQILLLNIKKCFFKIFKRKDNDYRKSKCKFYEERERTTSVCDRDENYHCYNGYGSMNYNNCEKLEHKSLLALNMFTNTSNNRNDHSTQKLCDPIVSTSLYVPKEVEDSINRDLEKNPDNEKSDLMIDAVKELCSLLTERLSCDVQRPKEEFPLNSLQTMVVGANDDNNSAHDHRLQAVSESQCCVSESPNCVIQPAPIISVREELDQLKGQLTELRRQNLELLQLRGRHSRTIVNQHQTQQQGEVFTDNTSGERQPLSVSFDSSLDIEQACLDAARPGGRHHMLLRESSTNSNSSAFKEKCSNNITKKTHKRRDRNSSTDRKEKHRIKSEWSELSEKISQLASWDENVTVGLVDKVNADEDEDEVVSTGTTSFMHVTPKATSVNIVASEEQQKEEEENVANRSDSAEDMPEKEQFAEQFSKTTVYTHRAHKREFLESILQENEDNPACVQPEVTNSKPLKTFDSSGSYDVLGKSKRFSLRTRTQRLPIHPSDIGPGNLVRFTRNGSRVCLGLVRYIGELPGQREIFLGLELERDDGLHDGVYCGTRYFQCAGNRGIFVAFQRVMMIFK